MGNKLSKYVVKNLDETNNEPEKKGTISNPEEHQLRQDQWSKKTMTRKIEEQGFVR